MNRNLTEGEPSSVLWRFCLPLFGSVLFQQLYNIADSFTAGKFIGNHALAAVGNSYEITLIFIAFAFGSNIGCSIVVSQLFGARSYRDLKTAIYTTMIACGAVCALLMLVGIGCGGSLLRMINTPAEIFEDSKCYLTIYALGIPFVFYYNVATGIFSALGDSKTPFIFLACSSVANIAIDIWFVAGFHMGVAGVGWATLICQGVSCLLALLVIFRRLKGIETQGKVPVFSLRLLRRVAVVAVPSILQQSFISVGNIMIQSVINGFGPAVIAGYAAGVKLNNMVITSLTTVGNGISNYTGQNLGAGKPQRIRKGFTAGIRMVWMICLPIALIYFFAGRNLIYLFMDSPTGEAMEAGIIYLRILAPFYFVVSAKLVSDGVLRGSEHMRQFMIGTFTDLILRVALAASLSGTALGSTGIWLAWPVGWTVSMLMSVGFYRRAAGEWTEDEKE